jgi:ligand-binding sensor domain-containing protein/serine phosphatase RsbU (regulator of sigma subunit)
MRLIQSTLLLIFSVLISQVAFSQGKALSLSPQKKLTQFILNKWTTDEGLHANTLLDVIQTKDGYIWISGYNGMSRFDGISFSVFNKANVDVFYTNTTTALYEDAEGVLWIGTEGGGLLSYANTSFKVYGKEDNFTHRTEFLFEDRDKTIWIGTRGAGVCKFNRKNITVFEEIPELKGSIVLSIAQDASGAMWFATPNKGLFKYANGSYEQFTTAQGLPSDNIRALLLDSRGNLWVGTNNGVIRIINNKILPIEALSKQYVNCFYEDALQNIWIGTNNEGLIRHFPQSGTFEVFSEEQGLPHKIIKDITSDLEGNLWTTTYRGGLVLIKDGKFTNYSQLDGLSGKVVNFIYQENKDKFLIGTDAGKVNIIEKGNLREFTFKNLLDRVMSITKDAKGNYWFTSEVGLLKVSPDGKETMYNKSNGLKDNSLRYCMTDKEGNVWFGSRAGGLAKITPDEKIHYFNKANGFPSDFIMSIDQYKDKMIIGTNDEGLYIMQDTVIVKRISVKEGLITNLIFNVYVDNDLFWIVGNGGLTLYRDGKCINYTTKEGLFNDSPFDVLEDKQGNFWLTSAKGIFTIAKKELLDFADGKISKITCKSYGKYDGMKQEDCTGATPSLKALDGKLWFPTLGGVSILDPENIPLNLQKPPVEVNQFIVDQFLVDNTSINLGEKVVLEAGKKRFVFNYTALSHTAPQKVNFKFKLEGFDEDWIDAGSQRSVTYTSLAYGDYTFRVIAANNDGIWNNEGASVKFYLEPFFWETPVFYGLCFFVLMLLVLLIYRWRVSVLNRRNEELENTVKARTAEIQQQKEEIETQRDNIEHQRKEMENAYVLIKEKNEFITDSIRYAKTIQQALLPIEDKMKQVLRDYFIIYRPKDIVSGDFYWFSHFSQELLDEIHLKDKTPKSFIAAVDCTGHGVPGAFMSMISLVLLNEIIKQKLNFDLPTALEKLDEGIRMALRQDEKANNDGMDICICKIEPHGSQQSKVSFTGAKRPLFYIEKGSSEVITIMGDKRSIGGLNAKQRQFTAKEVILPNNSMIYLTTDGFADQNNEQRHKLTTIKMLENFARYKEDEASFQKETLETLLNEHQKDCPQRDDITVIGVRL